MIPMWMKIRIPGKHGELRTLYLPLFIAWLILVPVLILVLPLIVVAAILTWSSGYGRFFLILYPMLFSLLWNLRGLQIDIRDKQDKIYFSFI